MKKLLFLVLIAFAISTAVENVEDLDVTATKIDWAAQWNAVKGFFTDAKNWLLNHNLYWPLVNAITNAGQKAAEAICDSHGIPGAVCSNIISWILKNVLNQK